jgi:hypothetical protein
MMTKAGLAVEAVVPFSAMPSAALAATPYRITLRGRCDERATAAVRLDRSPTSETDVVAARGEIVTSARLVFTHWELRGHHDDTLVADADMQPTVVHPFAPFPCVVQLFGDGTPQLVHREE